jgi:hypothetical protein
MLPIIGVNRLHERRRLNNRRVAGHLQHPARHDDPEKLRQQLVALAAITGGHFGQMVTTDGTDVTFHFAGC